MMDSLDFTEEEIQEQLALLGYKNIPKHRLLEFKNDLNKLIQSEGWTSPPQINSTKTRTETSRPSPPAYTKEKVSQSNFACREFFLNAGHADKQVLIRDQHNHLRPQQGLCDSYAQHSVAPRLTLPPGAPSRLQVEPDPDQTLASELTDSYTSSPEAQERRFIKRKVLRKHKGQSLVCDESVYSDDSDVASCLDDRLAELHVSPSARHDSEIEDAVSQSETLSSEEVSMSAFESYTRGMTRSHSDGDVRPKPKSFIRPAMNQQTMKKTDPVAKYFQYKQLWDMFKLPGEADRKAIRKEIQEQLAYQPPPPKPRRVYVPNTYVVPTEKKRSALRWEIRTDLANGLLPHSYRF